MLPDSSRVSIDKAESSQAGELVPRARGQIQHPKVLINMAVYGPCSRGNKE